MNAQKITNYFDGVTGESKDKAIRKNNYFVGVTGKFKYEANRKNNQLFCWYKTTKYISNCK